MLQRLHGQTARRHSGSRFLLTAAPAALLMCASVMTPAHAQTAPAAPVGVEELVVTAQRREERLQEAPLAVTAFSQEGLEQRNVGNLKDITSFTPNLEIHSTNRPAGGGSSYAAYIRGVGTGDFQFPTDPGVGVYLDGVYLARTTGSLLSIVDIARIEVLKGPQGTLYGKNTIGGAINVVSTTPEVSGAVSGLVQAKVGSYGRADFQASINGPIIDGVLGGKLSVAALHSDGWGRSLYLNERLSNENRNIVRGALRYTPTEKLDITLSGDVNTQKQRAPTSLLLSIYDPAVPGPYRALLVPPYNAVAAPFLNPQLGLPAASRFDARYVSPSRSTNYAGGPLFDNYKLGGVSLNGLYKASKWLDLRSISAYRAIDSDIAVDGDQSPYPLVQTETHIKDFQLSQEFQASGELMEGRLKFLAGLYAFREEGKSLNRGRIFEGLFEATGSPANARNTVTTQRLTSTTYSFFTQESFTIVPGVDLTAGVRFNKDKKDFSTRTDLTQRTGTTVPSQEADASWSSTTPKVGIDWKPTEDVMLYASYSEGFKSGGFGPSTATLFLPEYRPETLSAKEIGVKSQWFGHRLTLNAAAFSNRYDDIQLTVLQQAPAGGLVSTTQNGGRARIKGFEIEAVAAPVEGLTLNFGAGYIDAKFTSLTPEAIAAGLKVTDPIPQIPEWSINAGVQDVLETPYGHLTLRGDLSHKGSQYLTILDPTSYQGSYTTYSARISFVPAAWKNVEFTAAGTNLSNELYYVYKQSQATTGQQIAIPAEPRMYTFQVRYRF